MSIQFRCPKCGASYRVSSEHAGKAARCKHCDERLRVPSRGEELAAGAGAKSVRKPTEPDRPDQSAVDPRQGQSTATLTLRTRRLVVLISICTVALLATGGVLGWWLFSNGTRTPEIPSDAGSIEAVQSSTPEAREQAGPVASRGRSAGGAGNTGTDDIKDAAIEDVAVRNGRTEPVREGLSPGKIAGTPRDVQGEIVAVKRRRIGSSAQLVVVHARIENVTDHRVSLWANAEVSYRLPGRVDPSRYEDLRPIQFELLKEGVNDIHLAVVVPVADDDRLRNTPEQPREALQDVAQIILYVHDGRGNARPLYQVMPGRWPAYEQPGLAALLHKDHSFDQRFSMPKLQKVLASVTGVRKITREEQEAGGHDVFAYGDKYVYRVALLFPSTEKEPVSFYVSAEHHYVRGPGKTFGEALTGVAPPADDFAHDREAVTLRPGKSRHVFLVVDRPTNALDTDLSLYVGRSPVFPANRNDREMRRVYYGRLKK